MIVNTWTSESGASCKYQNSVPKLLSKMLHLHTKTHSMEFRIQVASHYQKQMRYSLRKAILYHHVNWYLLHNGVISHKGTSRNLVPLWRLFVCWYSSPSLLHIIQVSSQAWQGQTRDNGQFPCFSRMSYLSKLCPLISPQHESSNSSIGKLDYRAAIISKSYCSKSPWSDLEDR